MNAPSFSSRLRAELLALLKEEEQNWLPAFQGMGLAALRIFGRELRFGTRQKAFALLLQRQLRDLYGVEVELRGGREQTGLWLRDLAKVRMIRDDIFSFAETELPRLQWDSDNTAACRTVSAVLAELFLACGAFRSPRASYQMEFAMQRSQAVEAFQSFFSGLGLAMHTIRHQGYFVLYAKDGQTIADFLAYASAHQSLLVFEDLRVEKEVLNQVNRVVNCDSANAQRLAETSARQRERILYLRNSTAYGTLSPELKEAAEARLRWPELSLSELGQKMDPPLGKSGMNHRLKRLERLAMEEEEQENLPVVK